MLAPGHYGHNGYYQPQAPGRVESATTMAGVLSWECQKRGFNPKWYAQQGANGLFQCSVSLNGVLISPDGANYVTADMAKHEIAAKAIDTIRTWPVTKPRKSGVSARNWDLVSPWAEETLGGLGLTNE